MKSRKEMRLTKFQVAGGKSKSRRANAAFTLLEVTMAVVIAAIAFTAMFTAISSGSAILQNTRENLRATQIIQSRIEGLRLIAWGNSTNQLFNNTYFPTNFTDSFYPLGLAGNSTNKGAVYYGTITFQKPITNLSVSYGDHLASVTVSIQWTNQSGSGKRQSHSRTISTYVAQYGLQNYVYYATNN